MNPKQKTELIKMLWPLAGFGGHAAADGTEVSVLRAGEYEPRTDRFTGAEVHFGAMAYRGEIVCGHVRPGSALNYENVILHVLPEPGTLILKNDGTAVPQVIMTPDPVSAAAYESLCEGSRSKGCAGHIARMDRHERVALFTRLLIDRLERKCGEIRRIFDECEQNWNETMYVMLMRVMGAIRNKEPFTQLARKVSYGRLSRERSNIQYVEALLLGTSGLLEMYDDDPYIRDLKSDFEYLRHKYSITPMMPRQWSISHNNPHGHPVLRIAQLAAFFSTREFVFENMMLCRKVEDLQLLFRAEASQYWSTHYVPGKRSSEQPKRIGASKANLFGINLAVPMMFAYGQYVGDERYKEVALDLLEKIGAEENGIVNDWRKGGVVMESAFDSQAMLQLNNEHCANGLCWLCPVGKRVVREVLRRN